MKDNKLEKLHKALEEIKKEIEEHNLDAPIAKRKPRRLSKSEAQLKRKPRKLSKEEVAKKKLKKKPKKAKTNSGYTVADMAEDMEMIIADLRILLNKLKIKKPGTRWVWKNKTNSPLQIVKKAIREIAREKKLKGKLPVAKKKKKTRK